MARQPGNARIWIVHRWNVTAPPASPVDEPGNLIDPVGPATGAFAGYEGHLAVWDTLFSTWFFHPTASLRGDFLLRLQENQWYNGFDGTTFCPMGQWHTAPVRGDMLYFNGTVPAALTVGANETILTSDGTDPVWATPSAVAGTIDHGHLSGLSDSDHAVAALSFTATDKLAGRSTAGAGAGEEIACTAAGRALIDDADASAQRTTLGLGSIATQAANSVSITGGSITGITDLAIADGGTGQSTLPEAFDALSPLTTQGDIIYLDDGGNNVRLAIGTAAGQVLAVSSADPVPVWQNPRIFESAAWHSSTATAVGARTRGYFGTTSFDAGVCVPSGKTFKLWRQSTCVKTGATAGSNYDIEHGITEGVAFGATQIGTNLNNSNDTNVMFESVATDAETPLTTVAGPTRITMWWGVVTGSTGALAATQHSTQISFSIE